MNTSMCVGIALKELNKLRRENLQCEVNITDRFFDANGVSVIPSEYNDSVVFERRPPYVPDDSYG